MVFISLSTPGSVRVPLRGMRLPGAPAKASQAKEDNNHTHTSGLQQTANQAMEWLASWITSLASVLIKTGMGGSQLWNNNVRTRRVAQLSLSAKVRMKQRTLLLVDMQGDLENRFLDKVVQGLDATGQAPGEAGLIAPPVVNRRCRCTSAALFGPHCWTCG